jgi:uncharacterized membrane protein
VLVEMVDLVVVEMIQSLLVPDKIFQDQLNKEILVERLEVEPAVVAAVVLVVRVAQVMLLPIQAEVEMA